MMPKAKTTLWSTPTNVNEILGVMVWLCDPAVYSVMKNTSNSFIAQLSSQRDLTICMMLMHLKPFFSFKRSKIKCRESFCTATWKWILKYYGAKWGVRSCLSVCALLFTRFFYWGCCSSLNQSWCPSKSFRRGGKNKRIQNSISKEAIWSLLNEPQMMW